MRDQTRTSTRRARELRRNMSPAEKRLWQGLRARRLDGHRFRRQHPIGPYIADFVCLKARVIVEVDGPSHQGDGQIAHDRRRTKVLEADGWAIVRVGNGEVFGTFDAVLARIRACLLQHLPPQPVSASPRLTAPPLAGERR
jgi:very-short-patch-repair endonuclease